MYFSVALEAVVDIFLVVVLLVVDVVDLIFLFT